MSKELYFITGNQNKFNSVKALIPQIKRLDIDLPEIQSIDSHEIIKAKLLNAFEHHTGEFIVEDTSLTLKGMNGLPGPLIKWFLKSIGNEGVAQLATIYGSEVEAKTLIGYARAIDDIQYFEGVVEGDIVMPRGDNGFGWDPIFQPKGQNKTFAEIANKDRISMRRIAVNKLLEVL